MTEKTKYMLMSHMKAGQRQSIKIGNRSFERVAKFKYQISGNNTYRSKLYS
jgi:hypothetical protein